MKNKCPICGLLNYKELSFGGYYYKENKMPLIHCSGCDLMYVSHDLSKSEIDALYDEEEYFDSEYAGGAMKDYVDSRKDLEKKANRVLSIIKKYKKLGNLLDFGCAGGYFLVVARDLFGYKVKGLEISSKMVDYARKLDLDVYHGSLEDFYKEEGGSFDVVYLGDVLEHLPNPNYFISDIRKMISREGIIALEVPMSYNITIVGLIIWASNFIRGRFSRDFLLPSQLRGKFAKKPPYHLLMFTKKSMINFLEQNGFYVEYIKVYEGEPKQKFSGSLYFYLKWISHVITFYLPQSYFGDRMIVVARKIDNKDK